MQDDDLYTLVTVYRGKVYKGYAPETEEGTQAFDTALEAIASALPDGGRGDTAGLDHYGCYGGLLAWDVEAGKWLFVPPVRSAPPAAMDCPECGNPFDPATDYSEFTDVDGYRSDEWKCRCCKVTIEQVRSFGIFGPPAESELGRPT
jgi:hypothetical protein